MIEISYPIIDLDLNEIFNHGRLCNIKTVKINKRLYHLLQAKAVHLESQNLDNDNIIDVNHTKLKSMMEYARSLAG